MSISKPVRQVIVLWLAWAVILIGFQKLVNTRFQPQRPDTALQWTRTETLPNSELDQPYLIDPVLNEQVSWDSEFYLSIATVGYDDPAVRTLPPGSTGYAAGDPLSLNYAFFPLYPFVTRLVAFPLRLLGLTPVATSTVAGVIVSLLGALGAMLALYDIVRDQEGEAAGLRAAFYLIIFPTGFFLAQVYTEGLFVGLAFGSLALARRRQWVWAALLAALATWTRAVGAALVLPLVITWWFYADGKDWAYGFDWKRTGIFLLALSPIAAYLIWNAAFGAQFRTVEDEFFSRGALRLGRSLAQWLGALSAALGGRSPQTAIYYAIEAVSMLLALVCIYATARDYPGLSLFGLAVLAISATSGVPQSMARYVVAIPSLYMALARWGRHPVFDRAWTVVSLLLMGMLATLFSFDMWVA